MLSFTFCIIFCTLIYVANSAYKIVTPTLDVNNLEPYVSKWGVLRRNLQGSGFIYYANVGDVNGLGGSDTVYTGYSYQIYIDFGDVAGSATPTASTTASSSYSVSATPTRVASGYNNISCTPNTFIGDFNNDGLDDILISCVVTLGSVPYTYSSSVYLIYGSPTLANYYTLTTMVPIFTGGFKSQAVFTPDLNGDGITDIMIVNKYGSTPDKITLLLSGGAGYVVTITSTPTGNLVINSAVPVLGGGGIYNLIISYGVTNYGTYIFYGSSGLVTATYYIDQWNIVSPSPTKSGAVSLSPTRSASGTPSVTSTSTSSATNSVSASITASNTMTPTRTGTPTMSSEASYTSTRTPSASMTASPSITPTGSRTASGTPSSTSFPSPSSTPTNSISASASPTSSMSSTPSTSKTPSVTASNTASISAGATHSNTASVTASNTKTPSNTPSITASPTNTPTQTVSRTPTPSNTASSTSTVSQTASISATMPSVSPPPQVLTIYSGDAPEYHNGVTGSSPFTVVVRFQYPLSNYEFFTWRNLTSTCISTDTATFRMVSSTVFVYSASIMPNCYQNAFITGGPEMYPAVDATKPFISKLQVPSPIPPSPHGTPYASLTRVPSATPSRSFSQTVTPTTSQTASITSSPLPSPTHSFSW